MVDGGCSVKDWRYFASFTYCTVHKTKFKSHEGCPEKGVCGVSSFYTKKVATKHKKVATLDGMVAISHDLVATLRSGGKSLREIARELGVSHQYISKIVRRMGVDSSVDERLHNFSLTFRANVPYDSIDLPEVRLRNNVYKKFRNEEFFVQVFHDSVMVRYNVDIFGLRIHSSVASAIQRIREFVKDFYHIQFLDFRVSSGHNEFVNSPVARDVASKGQKIRYKDRVDGKVRTTIDFSPSEHNPSGAPMFEHEHSAHFSADSEKWEGIIDDVATDNYDPLHTTKARLDVVDEKIGVVHDVLDKVNDSIIELNKVTLLEIENKQLHQGVLVEMKDTMRDIRDDLRKRGGRSMPRSKKAKVRRLLRKCGW